LHFRYFFILIFSFFIPFFLPQSSVARILRGLILTLSVNSKNESGRKGPLSRTSTPVAGLSAPCRCARTIWLSSLKRWLLSSTITYNPFLLTYKTVMRMNSHDYLPQGDKDFLAWVVNFLKHLFPSLTRFGFPNDVYQALAGQRIVKSLN
jgi:hypothetical protein